MEAKDPKQALFELYLATAERSKTGEPGQTPTGRG